jgi:hypothetical protein
MRLGQACPFFKPLNINIMTEQAFLKAHFYKLEAILERCHHWASKHNVDQTMSTVFELVALLDEVVDDANLPYAVGLLRRAGASLRNLAWSFERASKDTFRFLSRLAINYLMLVREIIASQGQEELAESLLQQALGYAQSLNGEGNDFPWRNMLSSSLSYKSFPEPRLRCKSRQMAVDLGEFVGPGSIDFWSEDHGSVYKDVRYFYKVGKL